MKEEPTPERTECRRVTIGFSKKRTIGMPNYSSVVVEASVFETWDIAPGEGDDAQLKLLRDDRASVLRAYVGEQVPGPGKKPDETIETSEATGQVVGEQEEAY